MAKLFDPLQAGAWLAISFPGIGAAGLADYMDMHLLYLISALMPVGAGAVLLFLPELDQSHAQWNGFRPAVAARTANEPA